jgi:hypothetical protein
MRFIIIFWITGWLMGIIYIGVFTFFKQYYLVRAMQIMFIVLLSIAVFLMLNGGGS